MKTHKQTTTTIAVVAVVLLIAVAVLGIQRVASGPLDQSTQISSRAQLLISDLVFGVTGNELDDSAIFYSQSAFVTPQQIYADLGKQMDVSEKSDVRIVYISKNPHPQTPSVDMVVRVTNYEGGSVKREGNGVGHSVSGEIVSTNDYNVHIVFLEDKSSFVSKNWGIAEVLTQKAENPWQQTGQEVTY